MTRPMALAKVIKKFESEGKELAIGKILYLKKVLKWYGEDDIDDENWEEHVNGIIMLYEIMNKS